jgi:hypothetical protein
MGRSGSTLIWKALCETLIQHRVVAGSSIFTRRLVTDQAWRLNDRTFFNGVVYKTHGHASELSNNNDAKVVFVFGSALDAALSLYSCKQRYGAEWIDLHFQHLGAVGSFEEMIDKDVLRFREQVDGWINKTGTQRLILRYDAIWDYQDQLSEFFGLKVDIPERRQRNSRALLDPALQERLERTYRDLDLHLASLPDFQVLA